MELFAKIQIPKDKRVLTKVLDNELLIYFIDKEEDNCSGMGCKSVKEVVKEVVKKCIICNCRECDNPYGSRCDIHKTTEHGGNCYEMGYESDDDQKVQMVEKKNICHLYSDGGSRGNGSQNSVAGVGFVIYDGPCETKKVVSISKYLGKGVTNNDAEYQGLIIGLEKALELNFDNIKAHVDSKLVCEQVNGNWKINNSRLKVLCDEAKNLSKQFKSFELVHVLRHKNKIADSLANEAMDKQK